MKEQEKPTTTKNDETKQKEDEAAKLKAQETEAQKQAEQAQKDLENTKRYLGYYLLASLFALIAIGAFVYFMHLHNVMLKTVLYVGVAGAMGGVFYGIRGFIYHNAEDDFQAKWKWWYIYQPVTGFVVGIFSYFLIVGGLLTLGAVSSADYTRGILLYCSIAFLAGFATKKFNEKLDELASTLFSATAKSATAKAAPAAKKFSVSGFTDPATAGKESSVKVTALDSKGKTVTGYTGTVNFTSDDAKATLPPSYTFQATDKGVHTFEKVVLNTAGSRTVTVTDSKDNSITGSQTVNVNA